MGFGDDVCETPSGVVAFEASPIANDALSLSSRVGFETGLSSRSGLGDPLPSGDVPTNGLCDARDFLKFVIADSARLPVECVIFLLALDRSKELRETAPGRSGEKSCDSDRPVRAGRGWGCARSSTKLRRPENMASTSGYPSEVRKTRCLAGVVSQPN